MKSMRTMFGSSAVSCGPATAFDTDSLWRSQRWAAASFLNRLGAKDDKKRAGNISNALTTLTKSGHLDRQNGTYRLAGC
jgi:hypothetical protein